jgi:aspartate-semialdehyde dehydrogenase
MWKGTGQARAVVSRPELAGSQEDRMFREMLKLLGELDADVITFTVNRVYGIMVCVSRTVQNEKLLTMKHLIPIAEIVSKCEPALITEEIKKKWTSSGAPKGAYQTP